MPHAHQDHYCIYKMKYERKTRDLFTDLGLKNEEYNHMYERKRALERALAELVGIRLSSGVIQAATIEKTKDGKDYKVCFQKSKRSELAVEDDTQKVSDVSKVVINNYLKQKDQLDHEAEELVRYFHKTFHEVVDHTPQSKETGQAITLIAQCGFDAAKQIVDFVQREAWKTKFSV